MCEQAADAHKSKGVGHSLRRRMSLEPAQINNSSVDALLSNSTSAVSPEVLTCLFTALLVFLLISACCCVGLASRIIKSATALNENHDLLSVLTPRELAFSFFFLIFFHLTSILHHGSLQNSETPCKVFLINCLCAIQQPLRGHEVADQYVKKLGAMIDNHLLALVKKEVDAILRRCGLSKKMHHFYNSSNQEAGSIPLAEIEDTSATSLSDCLKAFFGLILGSESSLPEFEQIQVPRLRSEASIQVARLLAEAYELIYKSIMDPKNGYSDPKSLARHPPDQIRTILGI